MSTPADASKAAEEPPDTDLQRLVKEQADQARAPGSHRHLLL